MLSAIMFPPVHTTSRTTHRSVAVSFEVEVELDPSRRRRRRRMKVRSSSRYPPSLQTRHSSIVAFCTASNPQESPTPIVDVVDDDGKNRPWNHTVPLSMPFKGGSWTKNCAGKHDA